MVLAFLIEQNCSNNLFLISIIETYNQKKVFKLSNWVLINQELFRTKYDLSYKGDQGQIPLESYIQIDCLEFIDALYDDHKTVQIQQGVQIRF